MHRLATRSQSREGNRLLACAYSAVALAFEAGLIVALIHGVITMVMATAVAVAVMVVIALRHPHLLLRAAPAGDTRPGPETAANPTAPATP